MRLDILHQQEKGIIKTVARQGYFSFETFVKSSGIFTKDFQNLLFYKFDFLYCRSNHRKYSLKKTALKNFVKFTGKHLCWIFFYKKVATHRSSNFIKKRFEYRCFPVNTAKFFRTPILKNFSNCVI